MKLWQSPLSSMRSAAVLTAGVAALMFGNSLLNEFAYDDRLIILQNPDIHSLGNLASAFTKPYWPSEFGEGLGLWRPLTTWVYGLEWWLWGGAPVGFHLVNVLLNAAAAALVVVLLAHLMPLAGAFIGGLVFAVHPVHVEAVANVVGMAELLSAVLYLSACIVVVRRPGRMGLLRTLAVCTLFSLACLTKESAITFPAAVLLLDSCRRELPVKGTGAYLRRRAPLYAGLALVVAAVLWGRTWVLGSVADPLAPMGTEILTEGVPRIWTVLGTWPEVARLLFYPADLSSDYSPGMVSIMHGPGARSLLGLTLGLAAMAVAWAGWRQGRVSTRALSARMLGFAVVWFVITASPTSNVAFLSGVLLAERTLYLPTVGLAAAVGWLIAAYARISPRRATAFASVVLVLLACRSVTRNPTWRDNATVFGTMIANHPESARAQWVIGDLLLNEGRDREALAAYGRALALVDGDYEVAVQIAGRLVNHGYEDLGEFLFATAWKEHQDHVFAPSRLSSLYDRQERWRDSERAARAALAVDSTDAAQAHVLARALEAQGRLDEAVRARLLAIRQGEDRWEQWALLSALELRRGDTARALAYLDTARTRVRGPGGLARVDSTRLAILGPAGAR